MMNTKTHLLEILVSSATPTVKCVDMLYIFFWKESRDDSCRCSSCRAANTLDKFRIKKELLVDEVKRTEMRGVWALRFTRMNAA